MFASRIVPRLKNSLAHSTRGIATSSLFCGRYTPPPIKPYLHDRFAQRTVIVRNGMVDDAFRAVNRILGQEKLLDLWRRTRSYEKPFNTRRRLNYEKCKAIYDEDMQRKIQFVMRKNRADPYPGR